MTDPNPFSVAHAGSLLRALSLYMIYLPLRLYGAAFGDSTVSDYAISVLSCESSLLFPR